MEINKVYCGKMEVVLLEHCPDNYCDSIVTDPPYGLSFMGKHWDYDVPTVEQWKQAYRVLKPGGYMLAACGTRTQHRMVVNIEDAGFEIRDVITWHYGSGFPKSLDISKAIDKKAGAERTKVIGKSQYEGRRPNNWAGGKNGNNCYGDYNAQPEMPIYEAATDAAKEWEGWGTALKPATEFWTLCRKPLSESTVAENVLKHGTGGINIDGCRIAHDEEQKFANRKERVAGWNMGNCGFDSENNTTASANEKGRFPANVILDEFMGAELDKQSGVSYSSGGNSGMLSNEIYGKYNTVKNNEGTGFGDMGGASRFFYCPKPDNYERNKGLKDFDSKAGIRTNAPRDSEESKTPTRRNHHPTVKPIDLMRYLVRLVTRKGGICLDPFCGSGTTLAAAKMELMNYIGIDMDETHIPLAEARVASWNPDLYKPQMLF